MNNSRKILWHWDKVAQLERYRATGAWTKVDSS